VAAIGKWDALDLENAVTEADSICGVVRTPEEWATHPQSIAVDSLPLIEIVKIADSAPEPLPEGDRPMGGIRVVDVTRVIAAPMCGRTLAEHGADVMRISSPELAFSEALVIDTGYGKVAAEIDLTSEIGRESMRDLVKCSDVFSQGYRPGTIAGRGFVPEALADMRPGIVCVSLCAFVMPVPGRASVGSTVSCNAALGSFTSIARVGRKILIICRLSFGLCNGIFRRVWRHGCVAPARHRRWLLAGSRITRANCALAEAPRPVRTIGRCPGYAGPWIAGYDGFDDGN
jgi:crotonobetainyl-CoA:carnitine CoA-transferase CaiB-like acyl-CoA transferase